MLFSSASSSQCMPGTGVMTRDAYCGNFFNPFTGIALNGFTCGEGHLKDCSKIFYFPVYWFFFQIAHLRSRWASGRTPPRRPIPSRRETTTEVEKMKENIANKKY